MAAFICMFFPATISIFIKSKKEMETRKLLFHYFAYNIVVNLCCFAIVFAYRKGVLLSISESFNSFVFCMKYLVLSTITSIVLPYVHELICKNINIKLDVRKRKRNDEKS